MIILGDHFVAVLLAKMLIWARLSYNRCVLFLSVLTPDYFGRCSSELAEMVSLPYSWGRSSFYSDRLNDFSVTIPRCYKDVFVNSFFVV